MVWLTTTSSCQGFPTTLQSVYVTPRGGRLLGNSVWPPSNSTLACKATQVGTEATWPQLQVSGSVTQGPVTQSFVPEGAAGLGY